ncbi:MAG: hypothetical protein HY835_08455 [Anaerolineae bacterium]|nr:hypothetical protein [Anaerolineae bacterium]
MAKVQPNHLLALAGWLALAGGGLFALSQALPVGQRLADVDSGVFQYIGWKILQGGLPYRDVWDHKGPLIYFLNGLGLFLWGGNPRGIFVLEVAFYLSGLACMFWALIRLLHPLPALVGCAVWTALFLAFLDGGNLTEEYALLFSAAALLAFTYRRQCPGLAFGVIGLAAAGAFWLRPNLAGLPAILVGAALLEALRERTGWNWRWLAVPLVFILSSAGLLLYFAFHGGLNALLDQYFASNVAYIGSSLGLADRIQMVVVKVFQILHFSARYQQTAFFIAGLGVPALFLYRQENRRRALAGWLGLAVVLLEWVMTALSGRAFTHYFLSWLPGLALLAACAVDAVLQVWRRPDWLPAVSLRLAVISLALGVAAGMILAGLSVQIVRVRSLAVFPCPVLDAVRDNSTPADTLQVLGDNAAALNFAARRSAPTPFVYLLTALDQPANRTAFISAFLGNPPRLLAENLSVNHAPFSLQAGKRIADPVMQPFYASVDAHYRELGRWTCSQANRMDQWVVYQREE